MRKFKKRLQKKKEIDKSPLTKQLIRGFFKDLKQNKAFGDFINNNVGIKSLLENSDSQNAMISTNNNGLFGGRWVAKNIEIFYYNRWRHIGYESFFSSILGKTVLLKGLLPNTQRNKKALEIYLAQELANRNKKVYPNEVAFGLSFGTLYAILGFLLLILFLTVAFNTLAALIYLVFVVVVLISTQIAFNNHNR